MSQTTTQAPRTITPGSLLARVGVAAVVLLSNHAIAHAGLIREWAAAIDGSWTVAGNWLPAGVPTETDTAVLGLTGSYTVTFPSNSSVGGLSIENPEATLAIDTGRTLTLLGAAENDGTILVNRTAVTLITSLQTTAAVSITGSGSIVLNGGTSSIWAGLGSIDGGVLTLGAEQTVLINAGRIFGAVINDGMIISQALGINGSDISGTIDQTGGGVIRAEDGFARLVSAGITGGSFESSPNALVTASGIGNAWSGVANLGGASLEPGATVTLLGGGLVNEGTLTLNRTAVTLITTLQATEPASITGSGSIVLNGGTNSIWAGLGSVGTGVLTLGPDQTVLINAGRILGTVVNHGAIVSQATGINGSDISGTIDQTGGGVIRAEDGFARLVSAVITGGSFQSTGTGVVTASGAGNSWSGVTNLGEAALEAGAVVTLLGGGLVNNGTLTINRTEVVLFTTLQAIESATINGNGSILLNGGSATTWARIGATGEAVLTVGPEQTLGGNRGSAFGTIHCAGTLAPSGPNAEITIQNAFSFLPGGTLRIGLETESVVPRLTGAISGQVDIADATLVIADEGFAPDAFYRASIVSGPSYAGRFVDLDAPALGGGRVWRVLYVNGTTIDIAATCPADVNADGIVDAIDLGILLSNFGDDVVTPYSGADTNGDGLVDATDLGVLLSLFGNDC